MVHTAKIWASQGFGHILASIHSGSHVGLQRTFKAHQLRAMAVAHLEWHNHFFVGVRVHWTAAAIPFEIALGPMFTG